MTGELEPDTTDGDESTFEAIVADPDFEETKQEMEATLREATRKLDTGTMTDDDEIFRRTQIDGEIHE